MDKRIDLILSVSKVSSLIEVLEDSVPSTGWGSELEGPQESGGLSEVGSTGQNLVNQVLNADDAVLSKVGLDDLVVGDGNTAVVDLGKTSLVNELSHGLLVGISESDVRLNESEHVPGGLCELNEHTIVDLSQTQELQYLSGLGVKSVDTSKTNDESNLCLGFTEKVSSSLGNSSQSDQISLLGFVFPDVLLSFLEDDFLFIGESLHILGLVSSVQSSLFLSGASFL